MDGKKLKEKLRRVGSSQSRIARLLGMSPQSLTSIFNAADVRSGTIERIASVLNLPVSFFYDTDGAAVNNVVASGVNTGASVNGDVNIGDSERIKYLEELVREKERTIQILLDREPRNET